MCAVDSAAAEALDNATSSAATVTRREMAFAGVAQKNGHSSRNSQRKPAKTVILTIGDEEAASENRDPEVNPKGTSPRSRSDI
jgi:hypothetical protein